MWLRLLLIGLFVYFAIKILLIVRRYLVPRKPSFSTEIPHSQNDINDMVQDPVCGIYISSRGSVTAIKNGKTIHFCSEECRQRFLNY